MNKISKQGQLNKASGGSGQNPVRHLWQMLNDLVLRIDRLPLWWIGILFLGITFLPYVLLGEGSVFEIHDQLDETLLTYVLNARHLGDGSKVFPELLGGINKSGMQPSAVLFIPLYRIFPTFVAFMLQYLIVCAVGFFGMYACVKELTKSSILAIVAAACFAILPLQPIYGLSVWGVPLLIYVFLCLSQKKYSIRCALFILLFGLSTHLVLIGFVVLSFWALALLWQISHKKLNRRLIAGFLLLIAVYVVVNHNLFLELIFGGSDYVSHREELVNYGGSALAFAVDLFVNSAQHANSVHKYLILPIAVMLVLGAAGFNKLNREGKISYFIAVGIMLAIVGIAIVFGFCHSDWMAQWKNQRTGFLRYFQLDRYYWMYPTLWYLELIMAFHVWWCQRGKWQAPLAKLLVLALLLLPTINAVKPLSYFYMNVNQYNNGSHITGYITWESFLAQDLMEELEQAIGREMSDYRVAHVGMNTAPALLYGFYTVDGYSNNYPLEYKHKFREAMADELEKSEATKLYFDQWGSRCYLFNGSSGTHYTIGKMDEVKYEDLDYDMEALKNLGCEYLFSAGEILCAEELGLSFMGYYETETSYWGIWLYALK